MAGLVEEIEAEARADREARGIEPLGVEAILRQIPHSLPHHTKKSPAPAVHATSKAARQAFWEAYSTLPGRVPGGRRMAQGGRSKCQVPGWIVPPGLPFVSVYPALPP